MDWIKNLPAWAKTAIALFTSLVGLAILFINNKLLSIVIGIALALIFLLGLSIYIFFSKEQSKILPGRFMYRFPTYRPYAILGALAVAATIIALLSINQSRELIGLAFIGVPTPIADAHVELIDVSVNDEDIAPIIDIKVRNIGTKVAFLKRAVFRVLDYRIIPFCPLPSYEDVSHTYDVELPAYIASLPFTTEINISQSINPNDVDRFQFKMGTSEKGLDWIFYQLEIELIYNVGEDNRITTDKILVAIKEQGQLMGSYSPGIDDPEYVACLHQYFDNAIYMLNLPGTRSKELVDAKDIFVEQQKEFLEALKK